MATEFRIFKPFDKTEANSQSFGSQAGWIFYGFRGISVAVLIKVR